jgi:hypothetical protein
LNLRITATEKTFVETGREPLNQSHIIFNPILLEVQNPEQVSDTLLLRIRARDTLLDLYLGRRHKKDLQLELIPFDELHRAIDQ